MSQKIGKKAPVSSPKSQLRLAFRVIALRTIAARAKQVLIMIMSVTMVIGLADTLLKRSITMSENRLVAPARAIRMSHSFLVIGERGAGVGYAV